MVRKREGEQLDVWLEAVQTSQIPELRRFALGILRDYDAVRAGLTEIYSNGPVEAQVHKLKFVKRSMFGRAKLPLLRKRVAQIILWHEATNFGFFGIFPRRFLSLSLYILTDFMQVLTHLRIA
jgi:hypothetical protein